MHYFIYEAYRKHFKKDLFNGIKSMPKVMKISFFSWLALFLISLFVMLIIKNQVTYFIFAIVSTIATILLYGFSKIYNRKTLDTRIEDRKDRLKELDKWLKDKMEIKDKNSIKQLRNKMKIEINERHKSIDKVETVIFKVMEVVCIPILLAIFTYILNSGDMEISEKITTSAVVLTLGFLFSFSILLALYTFMTEVIKNEQYYYEMFVNDLQDVLDTQYEIKSEDILDVNN